VAAQGLGREHRPLSEINVTPLVDVMLVLLIIFMVTAPMMQQGLDVDLPETTTQPLRLKDDSLVLTVKKDGSVLLANAVVPPEELEEKLKAVLEGRE
jgi:biopolymer transport protein TolR